MSFRIRGPFFLFLSFPYAVGGLEKIYNKFQQQNGCSPLS